MVLPPNPTSAIPFNCDGPQGRDLIASVDTVGAGASLSVATQNPSPELVATVQPGHCQGVDPVGAVGDVGFPSVATPSVAS